MARLWVAAVMRGTTKLAALAAAMGIAWCAGGGSAKAADLKAADPQPAATVASAEAKNAPAPAADAKNVPAPPADANKVPASSAPGGGSKEIVTTPQGCTIEKFTIPSAVMKRDIKVAIVLPPDYANSPQKKFPVLYALHGSNAPYATWSEMRPLRAALKDKPMIVTCFDANGTTSGYADSATDPNSQFTTFFFKEFVPYVESHYRTNGQSGATGFSMGGTGSFHYMCQQPGKFAGVSALSSGFRKSGGPARDAKAPEAAAVAAKTPSIYERLETLLAGKVKLPHLFIACGTEDAGALAGTRAFRDFLKEKGLAFEYGESPGAHNWDYWQGMSEQVVDFHWRTFQAGYKVIDHPNPAAASPAGANSAETKPAETK